MSLNRYISGFSILIFALLISLFGILGCTKDQTPKEEPFVRLVENKVVKSKIFKRDINYSVLLPENYDKTTDTYPVVYLLHGFGDDQNAWNQYGLIQYYADLNVSENGPMIFVMPQGFNSYWVNRYDGSLPFMNYFITELVPQIDSIYRTKKDKTQRAVMGYSMGGYGALILPAKNPDIFSISVPLSMSFRTDEQYMAEPQSVFDNQWGLIFGGLRATGTARLTDYYKEYSPFYFFDKSDLSSFAGLKIFMDCGDDEESLSVTNGALHILMHTRNMPHEYRVRNGGHSWDYWHKCLPEALAFIGDGFKGISYPVDPTPVSVGNLIPADQYILENLNGSNLQLGIFKPTDYSSNSNLYPAIFFMHDYEGSTRSESAIKIISFLNNSMQNGNIPKSLIVEIPVGTIDISANVMSSIIAQISANYRIVSNKGGRVLIGNQRGGTIAHSLLTGITTTFNACFLFDAILPENAKAVSGLYYYVDVTDKPESNRGNYSLYIDLREKDIDHEYRVRQGTSSIQSTINGLNESLSYLSKKLKNQ